MSKRNSGFVMDRDGNSVVKNTEVTVQDVLRERTRSMVKQGAEELAEKEFRKDPLVAVDRNGNLKSNPVHGQLNDDFVSIVRQGMSTNVYMGVEKDNFMTMNTSYNVEVDRNDPRNVVLSDSALVQLFVLNSANGYKGQPVSLPILGDTVSGLYDVIGMRTATLTGWNGEVVRGKWSLDMEEIEHPTDHLYKHIMVMDMMGTKMVMLNVEDVTKPVPIPAVFTPEDTDKYDVKHVILSGVFLDERPELQRMIAVNNLTTEDVADEASLSKVWVTFDGVLDAETCSGQKNGSGNLVVAKTEGEDDDILDDTVMKLIVDEKESLAVKNTETGEEVSGVKIHVMNLVKKNVASEDAQAIAWIGKLPETISDKKPDELFCDSTITLKFSAAGYEDLVVDCLISSAKADTADTRPVYEVKSNTLVLTVRNAGDNLPAVGLHNPNGEPETASPCQASHTVKSAEVTGALTVSVDDTDTEFAVVTDSSDNIVIVDLHKDSTGTLVGELAVHPASDDDNNDKVIMVQVAELVDEREPSGNLVYSLVLNTPISVEITNSESETALHSATTKGSATVIKNCLSTLIDDDIMVSDQLMVKKLTFNPEDATRADLKDQYCVFYQLATINGSNLIAGRVSKLSDIDVMVSSDLVVEAKESGSNKGYMTVTAVSADGTTFVTMQAPVTITDSRSAS